MNKTQVATSPNENMLFGQIGFWQKIIDGWNREINRVMEKSETVMASPEVTADVARTAGALSVFADQLTELSAIIDSHKLRLPNENESDWERRHELLNEKLRLESQRLRTLLSEMVKLDREAYRRFLC